jgi:hypothetical protein
MWKKVVITEFEILFWYLPGGTKENHEIPQPKSRSPGPPKYEAEENCIRHLSTAV